jgi:hypothetical protein
MFIQKFQTGCQVCLQGLMFCSQLGYLEQIEKKTLDGWWNSQSGSTAVYLSLMCYSFIDVLAFPKVELHI